MLSCSIWICAPSFWMGSVLESHCVGRVYGVDGAVRLAHVYGADGAMQLARHHPHHTHNLCSSSQDHHPSKNSVQKTICCNFNI